MKLLLLATLLALAAPLRAEALDPQLTIGDITLTRYAEGSYEDTQGRTYFSGAAEPSLADATAAVATPTLPPAAPAPVPEVTRRQLFLWLNGQGHTRSAIRALLEAIPDATAREAALIEFDEALSFKRDHPLIAQLGAALGYTPEQIDAGFRTASAL